MTRADLFDLAQDAASLIAAAAFVIGAGLFMTAIPTEPTTAIDPRAVACRLAAAEPTDWNIEQCSSQAIDLTPSTEDFR